MPADTKAVHHWEWYDEEKAIALGAEWVQE